MSVWFFLFNEREIKEYRVLEILFTASWLKGVTAFGGKEVTDTEDIRKVKGVPKGGENREKSAATFIGLSICFDMVEL
jgi:hypothetical protein